MAENKNNRNFRFFTQHFLLYIYYNTVFSQEIFYPFGIEHGDIKMPPNDDGNAELKTSTRFPFYTYSHDLLYVNNNGLISFLEPEIQYSPKAFPLNKKRLIAPFWADVDTTRNNYSGVYYRATFDSDLIDIVSADIQYKFPEFTRFKALWLFIVTWDRVPFFGGKQNTPTNSFQLVLATNGRHSFSIFNYRSLSWTSGTASDGNRTNGLGGRPAQAGFNSGTSVNYHVLLPGSGTSDILKLASTTNAGINGRWIYKIDSNEMEDGGCNNGGGLTAYPWFGTMLGGTKIRVSGPCNYSNVQNIFCKFGFIINTGIILGNNMQAECYSPTINKVGKNPFEMSINNGNTYEYRHVFYTISPEDEPPKIQRIKPISWVNNTYFGPYRIEWNHSDISASWVDVELIGYKRDPATDYVIVSIYKRAPNNGILEFQPEINLNTFTGFEVGVLRITDSESNKRETAMFWSDIHITRWYTIHYLNTMALQTAKDVVNTEFKSEKDLYQLHLLISEIPTFVKGLTPSVINNDQTLKQIIHDRVKTLWNENSYALDLQSCKSWSLLEKEDPYNISLDDILPCPCNLRQALQDNGRYESDVTCNRDKNSICQFNPGAYHCVRTIIPSTLGAGQQCCYHQNGSLISDHENRGSGRLQRSHSRFQESLPKLKIPVITHYLEDILPYYYCCIWSTESCQEYFIWHPSSNCLGYIPPEPVQIWGDPHIMTLDGFKYTFNGLGEFWLLKIDEQFKLQGRTSRATDAAGNPVNATAWQALSMKGTTDEIIQLELNGRGIDVLINGQKLEFEKINEYRIQNIIVKHISDHHVLVILDNGLSLELSSKDDVLNTQFKIPPSFKGLTKGLFGTWNGNADDDLLTPDGHQIPINSTMEFLHYEFGIKWRTSPQESLFHYYHGSNHSSFQDPGFRPSFDLPPASPRAVELCGTDSMCLFDYAMTGKEIIVNASRQIVQDIQKVKKILQVTTCPPMVTSAHVNSSESHTSQNNVGNILNFECNSGYILSGSKFRICHDDGTWSGEEAHCYRPKCLHPTGLFLNFENCSTYYNCWLNIPHLQSCANGFFFNEEKGWCDFPYNVNQTECYTDMTDL